MKQITKGWDAHGRGERATFANIKKIKFNHPN